MTSRELANLIEAFDQVAAYLEKQSDPQAKSTSEYLADWWMKLSDEYHASPKTDLPPGPDDVLRKSGAPRKKGNGQ